MKCATFDENGVLNARYDSDINPAIPDGAIELPEALFVRTLSEKDGAWMLLGGVVTKVEIPNPLPQIPEAESNRSLMIVTRFQAMAALESIGELDAVEAYFSATDTPKLHKLAWENTLHFYRLSPLVEAVGEMLGLNDDQLDELFESAAGIQV